jgi:uroporphyrinogen-III synthase
MQVLITRPSEDTAKLAAALAARGVTAVSEKLLAIRPRPDTDVHLDGVQAVLLTSANGARVFARATARRDLPILAVGDATAEAARDLGFGDVASAGGDVGALAALARNQLDPKGGALLHVAGSVVAGDLAGTLEAAGFRVARAVLYDAEPAAALSEATIAALRGRRIAAAFFFSPRTAAHFVTLARAAGVAESCRDMAAFALSPAVAAALSPLGWARLIAAAAPEQAALLAAFDEFLAGAPPAQPGDRLAMTDRPNETSGTLPPRPDDAPRALDEPAEVPARETASERRPSAAEPEPARSGGSFGWIVAIVLIIGGVAASPWWAPPLAPLLPWSARIAPAPQAGAADNRLGPLEQRLAGAEQQIARLAQRPAPESSAAAPAGPDTAVSGRLDALEKRLAETEQRASQPGPAASPDGATSESALAPLRDAIQGQKEAVASLTRRVDALEKRPTAPAIDPAAIADLQGTIAKLGAALAGLEQRVGNLASANASEAAASVDPALLLALGQLRQALQGSGPFVAELGAATTLAAERPDVKAALAPLGDAAPRGVPSLAVLRQRFDALAGAIVDAGAAPAAADDWGGQVLGKLRGLVTVRRVGPSAGGNGADATVAQAESALAGDDLAGAVAALETLHGPSMVAARDWLDGAKRRLAAEAALGKATALVTARLASDRQPVTPAASGAKP